MMWYRTSVLVRDLRPESFLVRHSEITMLEIWGRPYSSNVIPVLWTAAECKIDYKLKLAGGSFGQLDTQQFAEMNPNRLIPTIRDGDFPLWESHVIVRYLCAKYAAGSLSPDNIEQRAVADQWMEWCGTLAFPPVIQLFFSTVRTDPDKRNTEITNSHASEAALTLSIFESHLENHNYVAGDSFTMGDIPLGAAAYRYFNVDIARPSMPNIEAWYARLCERPAYQKHVMRFFGTNPEEWQALEVACASEGD